MAWREVDSQAAPGIPSVVMISLRPTPCRGSRRRVVRRCWVDANEVLLGTAIATGRAATKGIVEWRGEMVMVKPFQAMSGRVMTPVRRTQRWGSRRTVVRRCWVDANDVRVGTTITAGRAATEGIVEWRGQMVMVKPSQAMSGRVMTPVRPSPAGLSRWSTAPGVRPEERRQESPTSQSRFAFHKTPAGVVV